MGSSRRKVPRKKSGSIASTDGSAGSPALDPSLLPDPDKVVTRIPFTSPKGKRFEIIRTNERDEYEEESQKE